MKKKTLVEEIERMFKIMNNDEGMVILESSLLLEGNPFESLLKGVENVFDKDAKFAAEKYLERSAESFDVRLTRYITDKLATNAGKQELRAFVKDIASASPTFARTFAEKNKDYFEKIEARFGTAKADEIITATFGDDVLKAYRVEGRVNPKVDPNISPISEPVVIPQMLKNEKGVKDFQEWMNNNYPTWYKGGTLSNTDKYFGTYGPNTKEAFKLYEKEYERVLLKRNVESVGINTELEIKNFQKWCEDHGYWSEDDYKLFGDGTLNDKTKISWDKLNTKYQDDMSISLQFDKSVAKVKSGDLKPAEGGWWDSKLSFLHPASKYTIFNSFRKSLFFYYKSVYIQYVGAQKEIDSIFSKALKGVEKGKYDFSTSKDMMRDISISFAALRKNADQRYDLMIIDFEKSLNEAAPGNSKDVQNFISELKTFKKAPFENMFLKNTKKEYDTWIEDVWADSSVRNTIRQLFEGSWKPFVESLFKRLLSVGERTLMFLSTGNVRTASEITSFMLENGFAKGVSKYIQVCYFMKFVLFPTFLSFFLFLKNMATNIWSPEDGWFAYHWEDIRNRSLAPFQALYDNSLGQLSTGDWKGITGFLPWSWYWDNLDEFGDDVAQQKIGEGVRKKLKEAEDLYLQKETALKSKVDSLQQVIINKDNDLKRELEQLKERLGNQQIPTGPTIQQFYEYIHSLDGRVGNVDLPYMHQDPSNPNKFTFEWSDGRGTKTYIYNGTTFSEQ
jgi:hypothetical protein